MKYANDQCQLYSYNKEVFHITKNSSKYFVEHFVKEFIEEERVAWLNYHSIFPQEEISALCAKLEVDRFVVEDIYTEKQRPKVESYDTHIFFSVRSALPAKSIDSALNTEQISFLLGEHYLISFQEKSSDHFTEVRERIELNKGKIRTKGPDFLLYRMLEAIVENYYEVLEEIAQNSQRHEKQLLRNDKSVTLQVIEQDKQRLAELRRIALPMKDVALQIQKSTSDFLNKGGDHYFDDLKDSCLGVLEEIDVNKQSLESLTNLYYAAQGQRMNSIMKVLTVISAIFIPLSFLVGLYGMNFDNMPELHTKNGYFVLLGAMSVIVLALLIVFVKRGWLSSK